MGQVTQERRVLNKPEHLDVGEAVAQTFESVELAACPRPLHEDGVDRRFIPILDLRNQLRDRVSTLSACQMDLVASEGSVCRSLRDKVVEGQAQVACIALTYHYAILAVR